ncbi:hypothetical protein BV20DRAFT_1028715 [Pilatotrama ljubarskyi]|nr:hypothetical protein BV20DRAFT_1028715 [Pilatotrama ljubarskyi]
MLFQSRLNPDVKSTQELIVLCHEQGRVLVPLPKTFEDAQNTARDVFGLTGDIAFETTDLFGSADTSVRIHSTAWEGVSSILHTVLVKSLHGPTALPRRSEAPSSSARRLSSQRKAVAGPSAVPIRLPSVAASRSPARGQQTASPKKAPLVLAGNRTDTSTASAGSSSSKKPQAAPTSKAGATSAASAPGKTPAPPETPEESEEEDEAEEEIRIVSPTKKRVARPRILSDYGVEPQREPAEEHGHKPGAGEASNSEDVSVDEEYDELEDTEFISAAPPPQAKPAPSSSQGRAASAVKPASGSRGGNGSGHGNGSLVQLDAMPEVRAVKAERERAPSPKIKLEKAQPAKSTPVPASQSQDTAAASQSQGGSENSAPAKADESFVIMIEYNDDPESRSLFKTRARHTVSKVLMQACRTFGLAEHYNSARLVLLVEDEDEGQVYRSVCNRTDTMGQAGAEPNARFVVEIDGDGEGDD